MSNGTVIFAVCFGAAIVIVACIVGRRVLKKAGHPDPLADIFKFSWNMPGVNLPEYKAPRFLRGKGK